MIEFPQYSGKITNPVPTGIATVNQVVETIRNPNKQLRGLYQLIRYFKSKGNKSMVSRFKADLIGWTPAVHTDMKGRSGHNITSFTGLMPIDFDNFPSMEYSERFRDALFDRHDFILASWLSVSARGVRAFVRIPIIEAVDEYKALFWGVRQAMIDLIGFDSTLQTPVKVMYSSYDPNIRTRKYEDTTEWIGTAGNPKPTPKPMPPPINLDEQIQMYGNRYKEWSVKNLTKAIESITDEGHPIVVRAARALGGRVAAGYLSFEEAESIIHNLIARNAYLQKGIRGYQTTATTMIKYGMEIPSYF